MSALTNGWRNSRYADDLRRHSSHFDVTVISTNEKNAEFWPPHLPTGCPVIRELNYPKIWSEGILTGPFWDFQHSLPDMDSDICFLLSAVCKPMCITTTSNDRHDVSNCQSVEYLLPMCITATSIDRHGVSNYQSVECLFNSLFRSTINTH